MKCPKCGTEDAELYPDGADCRLCTEPFKIAYSSSGDSSLIASLNHRLFQKKDCSCMVFWLAQGVAVLPCKDHQEAVMKICS